MSYTVSIPGYEVEKYKAVIKIKRNYVVILESIIEKNKSY